MSKNITLKPKEELKLIKSAQEGLKLYHENLEIEQKKQKKSKKKIPSHSLEAIRLLIYYNLNLIKYIVRGYWFYSSFGQIDYEDLVSEGIAALLKAIEKFDPSSGKRLATYAGPWIKQRCQTFISKSQFINQSPANKKKRNLLFYDSSYQNQDEQSKSYSLLDTLDDSENLRDDNQQIYQRDTAIQVNNLINSLENREKILLIRLSHMIVPSNLLDIYYIAEKDEQEELKRVVKLGQKEEINMLRNYSLREKKFSNLPIVKKYLAMFAKSYKFSEITKLLSGSENSIRKLKKESFEQLQELAKKRNLRLLIG